MNTIDTILKIAKVKDIDSFYKKFPSEEAFMAKCGGEFKKAMKGAKVPKAQDGFDVSSKLTANMNDWFNNQHIGLSKEDQLKLSPTQTTPFQKMDFMSGTVQTGTNDNGIGKAISSFSPIAGGIIKGIQQLKEEKERMLEAKQWRDVTDVQLQASNLKPERIERKYLRPEDYTVTGEEMFPTYGTGSNVLAKDGIYIKPSKRGTFTAAAKKRGKGVQEFAKQVMANKDNYSPAMVKKANFAKNASKWKKANDGAFLESIDVNQLNNISETLTGGESGGGTIGGAVGDAVSYIPGVGPIVSKLAKPVLTAVGNILDTRPERTKNYLNQAGRNASLMMANAGVQGIHDIYSGYMEDGGTIQPIQPNLQPYQQQELMPIPSVYDATRSFNKKGVTYLQEKQKLDEQLNLLESKKKLSAEDRLSIKKIKDLQYDLMNHQLNSMKDGGKITGMEDGGVIKQTPNRVQQFLSNIAGEWNEHKPQLMKDFPITDFSVGPVLDYISGKSDVPPMPIGKVGNLNVNQTIKMPPVYKINPWAFKPNPEAYYHRSPNLKNIINKETNKLQGFGLSEEGMKLSEMAKPRGINLLKPANSNLYFSKGVPLDYGRYNTPKVTGLSAGQGYRGPYLVEVENVPFGAANKSRNAGELAPTRIGSYATSKRPINVDEVKFYKEDWLRGYKEIPKKENGGQINENMDGDLQIYDGNAETISQNPFLPDGGETIMFRGPSHSEGGMDIAYGNTPVEVEGGEPATKMDNDSLVVYGDLTAPGYKGKKFKNVVKKLSEDEERQKRLIERSIKDFESIDVQTPLDKLKLQTLETNIKGATMKQMELAQEKEHLASLQEAINQAADEQNLDASALAKGKIKKAKKSNSNMAQDGKTVPDSLYKAYGFQPVTNPTMQQMAEAIMEMQNRQNRVFGYPPQTPQSYVPYPDTPVSNINQQVEQGWEPLPELLPIIRPDVEEPTIPVQTTKTGTASGKTTTKGKETKDTSGMVVAPEVELEEIPIDDRMEMIQTKDPVLTLTDIPTKNNKFEWFDVLSSLVPYFRGSDVEELDPRQIMGELAALSDKEEPVWAQTIQPDLASPYEISLQDQKNEIIAQTRAAQKMAGNNPAAQAIIASQASDALNKIQGEEFRINQAMKDKVFTENRNMMNQTRFQNLAILDKLYERQSMAKSKTKETLRNALNSISDKYLKNRFENRTLATYENLYDYRFDDRGRAWYKGRPAGWNTEGSDSQYTSNIPYDEDYVPRYERDPKTGRERVVGTRRRTKDEQTTARNGAIVRALKRI